MKKSFLIFLFCLFTPCLCPAQETSWGYPAPDVNRNHLAKLLLDERFDSLTLYFENLYSSFEQDYHYENHLSMATDAFYRSDTVLAPLFHQWVSQFPDRFSPYLARGTYRLKLLWNSKYGHPTKVTAEQVEGDFLRALEINPRLITAYEQLINLYLYLGKPSLEIAHKATNICPECFNVRLLQLLALRPRYNGSFEQMEEYVKESLNYSSLNPKLSVLPGYIPLTKAQQYEKSHKRTKSFRFYTRAVESARFATFLSKRAEAYFRSGKLDDARDDLNQAISIYPYRAKDYFQLALVSLYQGKPSEAEGYLSKSFTLSRFDPEIQKWTDDFFRRGIYNTERFKKKGDLETSLEISSLLIALEPARAEGYLVRAEIFALMYQLEKAKFDLESACKLGYDEACRRLEKIHPTR